MLVLSQIDNSNEDKKEIFLKNFKNLIIYSLTLATALSINYFVTTIFENISNENNKILAGFIYVVIMILLTLFAAYTLQKDVVRV